jgi:aerotolerance regulator-like protein
VFQILWQNPAALFALAAIAAPILIHILVQRRAERLAFPTLRFLQPTRLAAIRRHVLEDPALLAVRAAILAAAVAAFAAPLILTPARRQVWERRVVRAVVLDTGIASRPAPAGDALYRTREFTRTALPDAVRRAVAWLEASPPARRELVVMSTFPIGAIAADDIAAIPSSIGIQLERSGALPPARSVDGGRVLAGDATVSRSVTLDGARTSLQESPAAERAAWPVEIVNPPSAQPAVEAAVAAVLSQRVWAPSPDRHVQVVIKGTGSDPEIGSVAIRTPWIADAVATLMRDDDLQSAAGRIDAQLVDANLLTAPWMVIARSAEGHPLAIAAESPRGLVVVSGAPPFDVFTPILLRAVANAAGAAPDLRAAEVVPLADRQLREWSRPPAAPGLPDARVLERDDADNDRRWLWTAALCLLAVEMWVRRRRGAADDAREEAARVA